MKHFVLATLCIVILAGTVTLAQENAAKIAIEPINKNTEDPVSIVEPNMVLVGCPGDKLKLGNKLNDNKNPPML